MATRELSVVYGTRTLGGSSTTCLLDAARGGITITEDADQVTVACEFVAREASAAAFATLLDALETDLRDPRQDLTVVVGAATWKSWRAADNTGYLQAPTLEKVGDVQADSGVSQRLRWTCHLVVPANLYDQSGRAKSSYTVRYTPARFRQLELTGEYRRQDADLSAVKRYQAQVETWASSIYTPLGGAWELAEESYTPDEIDAVVQFSRVYDEIPYNQSAGTVNDTRVVRQQLWARQTYDWPGDTRDADRPATLEVRYAAWVDKEVASHDLPAVWRDLVRPWLLAHVRERFRVGAACILHESVNLDNGQNRIEAEMRLLAPQGNVLELAETTTLSEETGVVLEPVWSGSRFARLEYQGPATLRRLTATVWKELGKGQSQPTGGAGGGGSGGGGLGAHFTFQPTDDSGTAYSRPAYATSGSAEATGVPQDSAPAAAEPAGGGGHWVLISTQRQSRPLLVGDPARGALRIREVSTTTVEEWSETVRGSTPSSATEVTTGGIGD